MMKTVLITGGAGYIGSHTAKAFAKTGYAPVVVDNLIYGHRDFVKWGEFIQGDIGDTNLLKSIFSSYDIDIVSHFAAFAYVGESVSNPLKYYDNNVVKAVNLLREAASHDVDVFQFSSTCATYGLATQLPIEEDHPQIPVSPYGNSKLFFENILKDVAKSSSLNYSILRYFNAAGADPEAEIGEDHQPETHLIPLSLLSVLDKDRSTVIKIFGTDYDTPDGTCIRDYIHVTDLADAHVLAAEKSLGGINTTYNLGNGEGFSVWQVLDMVQKVTGRELTFSECDRRPGDPCMLIGSSTKIRTELGWQPQHSSLEEIIKTAWQWHQKRHSEKRCQE